MRLSPREQRVLAKIEHSLRLSDPRLAQMLVTFTLPAFRGGIQHLFRLRIKDFAPPALAIMAISMIIAGSLLLSHTGRTSCALRSARPVAAGRLTVCQPANGTSRPVTVSRDVGGL